MSTVWQYLYFLGKGQCEQKPGTTVAADLDGEEPQNGVLCRGMDVSVCIGAPSLPAAPIQHLTKHTQVSKKRGCTFLLLLFFLQGEKTCTKPHQRLLIQKS